jgi:hypothetical protein
MIIKIPVLKEYPELRELPLQRARENQSQIAQKIILFAVVCCIAGIILSPLFATGGGIIFFLIVGIFLVGYLVNRHVMKQYAVGYLNGFTEALQAAPNSKDSFEFRGAQWNLIGTIWTAKVPLDVDESLNLLIVTERDYPYKKKSKKFDDLQEIELEWGQFEDKLKVFTNNHRLALEVLTPDIMETMYDTWVGSHLAIEIHIRNNLATITAHYGAESTKMQLTLMGYEMLSTFTLQNGMQKDRSNHIRSLENFSAALNMLAAVSKK